MGRGCSKQEDILTVFNENQEQASVESRQGGGANDQPKTSKWKAAERKRPGDGLWSAEVEKVRLYVRSFNRRSHNELVYL